MIVSRDIITKALIRPRRCTSLFAPLLFACNKIKFSSYNEAIEDKLVQTILVCGSVVAIIMGVSPPPNGDFNGFKSQYE